jgi:hypothetical protein
MLDLVAREGEVIIRNWELVQLPNSVFEEILESIQEEQVTTLILKFVPVNHDMAENLIHFLKRFPSIVDLDCSRCVLQGDVLLQLFNEKDLMKRMESIQVSGNQQMYSMSRMNLHEPISDIVLHNSRLRRPCEMLKCLCRFDN